MLCVGMHVQSLSRVRLFGTPWTVVRQAPLSMEFSRQEYRGGCQVLVQGIFLTSDRIASLALAGRFFTSEPAGKPHAVYHTITQLLHYSSKFECHRTFLLKSPVRWFDFHLA